MPQWRRSRPRPRLVVTKLRRDPLGLFAEMKRTQGDVARVRFGRSDFFLVSHPDLIKRILVAEERNYVREAFAYKSWRSTPRFPRPGGLLQPYSDHDVHLRARRALHPLFRRARVDSHWPELLHLAEQASARWRDGETINIADEAYHLVLPLVTRAHFGADLGMPVEELARHLRTCASATVEVNSAFYELAARKPGRLTQLAEAQNAVLGVLARHLDEARRERPDGDDLAAMLVRIGEAEGLTERELALEVFGHVLNSPDTSVSAISWAVYLLSQHPEALGRLREEIDAAREGAGPEGPTPGDLPYTFAVIAETLRLYPSTWRLKRRAVVDHELAGREVRRGAHVWVSPPIVHRDERWWPDPHAFKPERWLENPRPAPLTYLPFGAGQRKCLGEQIAWRELTAILFAVLGRWELRLEPGSKVVPRATQTLRPAGGLRVRVERRVKTPVPVAA